MDYNATPTRYVILHFASEQDQLAWLNWNVDLGYEVASSCSSSLKTCLEVDDDESFLAVCRNLQATEGLNDFECV